MRTEIQSMGATCSTDVAVTPNLAVHSELLKYSAGRELLGRLGDFISTTWDIDTRTSSLCVSEAVLIIEAEVLRRSITNRPKCEGGLGICRVHKVEKFIDADLDQRIAISELAPLVRIELQPIQRAFRQSFGEPTHMYLSAAY